ncbi:MAG: GNAT family N-acetyltransferase [Alphaproteobacteria bacterium]|nr:GNAT family N-acetyltransferase [Alphaproteobacteria bacterium]
MKTQPQPPLRMIRLETPHHIVRTVERADATERWCNWLLDPVATRHLNAAPQAMTMDQLLDYIDRFDRKQSHLLGIFDKDSGIIVGVRAIYIDFARRAFLDNILVGEVEARGKHARAESTDVILPYFFDELDLLSSHCTIMANNQAMHDLVARKGWILKGKELKPSADGRGKVELFHYRLDRETWRQKMRERAAQPRA